MSTVAMDPLAERRKDLFACVAEAKHRYETWAKDDTIQTIPLDSPLFHALENMVELFAEGDIPGPCRKLFHAVFQFSEHCQHYKSEVNELGDPNHQPSRDFFAALNGIFQIGDITVRRRPVRIESVKELKEQKVPDLQIAKIKNWRRPDGSWDTDRVKLAHDNPDKYDVDTIQADIEKEIEADLAHTQEIGQIVNRKTEAARGQNRIAPESIDALARSGMTVEMIAVTKGIPIDEVFRELANFGIDPAALAKFQAQSRAESGYLPQVSETESRRLDAAANMQGNVTPESDETDLDGDEDFDVNAVFDDEPATASADIEAKVMGAHAAGVKPGMIATLVGISVQKVVAIISRNNDNQSAA